MIAAKLHENLVDAELPLAVEDLLDRIGALSAHDATDHSMLRLVFEKRNDMRIDLPTVFRLQYHPFFHELVVVPLGPNRIHAGIAPQLVEAMVALNLMEHSQHLSCGRR